MKLEAFRRFKVGQWVELRTSLHHVQGYVLKVVDQLHSPSKEALAEYADTMRRGGFRAMNTRRPVAIQQRRVYVGRNPQDDPRLAPWILDIHNIHEIRRIVEGDEAILERRAELARIRVEACQVKYKEAGDALAAAERALVFANQQLEKLRTRPSIEDEQA